MRRDEIIEKLIIYRACLESQGTPACKWDCTNCGFRITDEDLISTLECTIDQLHKVGKYRKKAKRWKSRYLSILNPSCIGVEVNIIGDKYVFEFTDGMRKVVDCIVDKRGGQE